MRFQFFLLLAFSWSAHGLVTFQSGDVATAEDFNSNFQELKDEAISNTTAIEDIKSNSFSKADAGRITALVNGETREVSTFSPSYNMVYIGQNTVMVGADGELPWGSQSYYESSDCTGQPYISVNHIDLTKPIGEEFVNPQVSSKTNFHKIGGEAYYETGSPLVKLHHKSLSTAGNDCFNSSGTIAAVPAYPNNPDLTGISFPIIISGVGTSFSITEEVGVAAESGGGGSGNYKVYGDGVEFGFITSLPNGPVSSLSVTLIDYNQQVITVYSDGTYSGFNNGGSFSRDMYFKSADCMGTGYFPYLPKTYAWWDIEEVEYRLFKNGFSYYTTGGQLYLMTSAPMSYKLADTGICSNSVSGVGSTGEYTYREAELTANPELTAPVINVPITIEGWNPAVTYQDLPEVN